MISKLPSKARQILITWVAAWPTLTLILCLLQPFSTDWPLPMRSLASATGMVLMMNLVSVPLVRRWLAVDDRSKPLEAAPSSTVKSENRSISDAS